MGLLINNLNQNKMEDLKIRTPYSDLTLQGFDGGESIYIDLENNAACIYTWLTVDETKQLVRHLIGALGEVGETI